jgi:hypothetical protein
MSQSDRPLPYQPRGAVDGCVVDADSCRKMKFYGRWGSSCGTAFVVKDFIARNKQWKRYETYLHDRPSQTWTTFTSLDKPIQQKRKYTVKRDKKRNVKKNTYKRK